MGWPFFVSDTVKRARAYRDELKQAEKDGFKRGVITTLVVEGLIALGIGWLISSSDGATIEDAAIRQQNNPQGIADTLERTAVGKPGKVVEARKAYLEVAGKEQAANDTEPLAEEAHENVYASLSHE